MTDWNELLERLNTPARCRRGSFLAYHRWEVCFIRLLDPDLWIDVGL